MIGRFELLTAVIWFSSVIIGAMFIQAYIAPMDPAYHYIAGAGIGGAAAQLAVSVPLLLSKRGDTES